MVPSPFGRGFERLDHGGHQANVVHPNIGANFIGGLAGVAQVVKVQDTAFVQLREAGVGSPECIEGEECGVSRSGPHGADENLCEGYLLFFGGATACEIGFVDVGNIVEYLIGDCVDLAITIFDVVRQISCPQ
ncbi:MAG: hypothetical protein P1V20_01435 [Verrucomicrobiales bacterium]|nr:hypothetical protein [Verrucomicrobiales bacterium]